MSSVPKLGLYVSEDKNFEIQITKANPENGRIDGFYEASYSPETRGFRVEGEIGRYSWVRNASQNRDGVSPFSIRFTVGNRPEGRPYCIYDTWTGAYRVSESLLMNGSRSYVNEEGTVVAMSLGTMEFFLAEP